MGGVLPTGLSADVAAFDVHQSPGTSRPHALLELGDLSSISQQEAHPTPIASFG